FRSKAAPTPPCYALRIQAVRRTTSLPQPSGGVPTCGRIRSHRRLDMTLRIALGLLALGAGTLLTARAEDWSQFRGPGGSAVSPEKNLPGEWGTDKNIQWKAAVPGVAWSCPIVVGDKVIVTTAVTDNQKKPKAGMGGFGGPGGKG